MQRWIVNALPWRRLLGWHCCKCDCHAPHKAPSSRWHNQEDLTNNFATWLPRFACCNYRTSRRCIPYGYVGDSYDDCRDNSDETGQLRKCHEGAWTPYTAIKLSDNVNATETELGSPEYYCSPNLGQCGTPCLIVALEAVRRRTPHPTPLQKKWRCRRRVPCYRRASPLVPPITSTHCPADVHLAICQPLCAHHSPT